METEVQSDSAEQEEKLNYKRIFPIFVIVLIDLMGLTIIIPLLPLYAASFGASPALIGGLGATYPVMQFLGAPILGRLSDRYGRKPVLVVSQIGTLIGFILLGLATSLPILFLSRIIDGISGANIATAQAAITDSTTEKTRTQGLGLIGAAFGLGFIIGPLIAFAALAISGNDYRAPAFLAALFSLLSILLTAFWFRETLPEEQRGQNNEQSGFSFGSLIKAISHPTVGVLLVLIFAQQVAFGGFEQLLALFTLTNLGLNASGNSVIFVYVGVIVVAVQGYFIGRWSRRFGDRRLVYGGLALLSIGLILLAFTPRQPPPWYSRAELNSELSGNRELPGETPPTQDVAIDLPEENDNSWLGIAWLLVAMVPLSIGGGILQPAINSLITKRIEPEEVGGMLGISTSFTSAANAIAPLIGGLLFEAVGPRSPFFLGGILMGLLWILALRAVRAGREEEMSAGLARGGGGH
ncbi:MAG: MFS transporter [Candidatus Promineifilaceae bacterium]|nr:MFS transporter [Candidatus Promineifilaceae bacterium]